MQASLGMFFCAHCSSEVDICPADFCVGGEKKKFARGQDDLANLKLVRGLSNEAGYNNCFLNVVIQSLWHLRSFRHDLLALNPEVGSWTSYQLGTAPQPHQTLALQEGAAVRGSACFWCAMPCRSAGNEMDWVIVLCGPASDLSISCHVLLEEQQFCATCLATRSNFSICRLWMGFITLRRECVAHQFLTTARF